jgi:glycosyltransferase involved in cell wall biosynthesis
VIVVLAPKISIIIPSYNSSDTIRNTLDSALAQTLLPHEIIVIDDCSQPPASDILGHDYPDVIVKRHKHNLGVQHARNTGYKLATGELILFLDADDILFEDFLETTANAFQNHPNIAAYFGNFYTHRNENEDAELPKQNPRSEEYKYQSSQSGFTFYINNTGAFLPSFTVIKKSALEQITIASEVFPPAVWGNEDFHLFIRILTNFETIYGLDEMGVYFLQPTSISQNQIKVWDSRVIAIKSLLEIFESKSWNLVHLSTLRKLHGSSLRVYARLLSARGERKKALKLLTRNLNKKFEFKTLALIALILLGQKSKKYS